MHRKVFADDHFHNIVRRFDVLAYFSFTASETMQIITDKHGRYKLPHELPNNLKLRILGNWEILGKCLNFIE